jgi:hypothetical protein
MTCEEAREALSAYLDEALAPEERSRVEGHLEGCAECRRELAAVRATVALLRRVEPARAPVGFADRVAAAAQPRPWYRRVAGAVFLPLSIKLPLGATAAVMVGLLAVFLFERTPELQRAAREATPRLEPAAPSKERKGEGFADRAGRSPAPAVPAPVEAPARRAGDRRDVVPAQEGATAPPATSAPAPPAASAPPPVASPPSEVAKPEAKTEAASSENVAAAARPEAESRQKALPGSGDSERGARSVLRPAAKRAPPPADVVARVAVRDRDAAERELATLIARVGGSVARRRSEDDATVVEALIPQPRYAEFAEGVARIGSWRLEAERPDLPAQIHVILRLQ